MTKEPLTKKQVIFPNLRTVLALTFFIGWFITGCTSKTEFHWTQEDGHRWAELSPGYFGSTGFRQLDPASTNIQFKNFVSKESITENRHFLNGSGVAAADVDGDGWVDLYFARLEGPNKLYKNLRGLRFKEVTEEAGVAHEGYHSTGVVFADVDGDGDPDLLVTSLLENNELYINDGQGHFELKKDSGLGPSKGSNTMALADIDGDGDLDLYISNYKLKTVRDLYSAEELSTRNTVRKEGDSLRVIPPFDQYYGIIQTENRPYRLEYGEEDELYINKGEGIFQKVENPQQRFLDEDGVGVDFYRGWGLTAKFQDLNKDLLPDLYVANDFWTPDRFWINQGDGVFKQIAQNALPSLSFSSMGVDFSDIDRNGSLDFFVTEMLSDIHQRRMRQLSEHLAALNDRPQYNRNSLYLNRGDETFAEISYYGNLAASEWSWATNFLDVDLDGYEDLVITTGHAYDYQDMDTQLKLNRRTSQNMQSKGDLLQYPPLKLANKIFRNNRNATFTEKSGEWGFVEQDISLGMAIADLDNDGDPDLALNRLNQEAAVYENSSQAPRIAVQLNGSAPNTQGIGAKVELRGAAVMQTKEVTAGGTYVSGSQPAVFFAADPGNPDHTLTVTWRNGNISVIDSVRANRIYVIDEAVSLRPPSDEKQTASVSQLFEDVAGRISHIHHEDPYTDFNVQDLLPVKISQKGPGISWIDIDQDGDDDLLIPSGKGGRLAGFENTGGAFRPFGLNKISRVAAGDQTTVLGWGREEGLTLFVGSANFEQGDPGVPSARQYNINKGMSIDEQSIPGILSTTGPLAAADYDADGDLDLFVGGSFNPGRYPEDASSRLFKNEKGIFKLDQRNSRKLSDLGLASGAVFSDYDQDGDPDLLISREWDSILILENSNGNYRDITAESGLANYKGWWNGIATGDFNNDGRPDIIATNIGENSVYQMENDSTLKLFYADFNKDGQLDIVDAYYDASVGGYVPRRKLYEFDSVPSVLQYVRSHEAFANSTVEKIFGRDFSRVPFKEINTLKHTLFLNTNEGFDPVFLPEETQFSAAFHVAIADFDSDGNEDLFLSQNLFPFPPNIPRLDSGRGLLLRGGGKGNFEVIAGQESGIKIYGEQRGASVSDFNSDGKPDLAVTQNEAATKLYVNQAGKSGLRIKLNGPSLNRDAIGSAIRLIYGDDSKGPLKEVQAGSGYWSQHSTTRVLGYHKKPKAVEVIWFDGSKEVVDLPADVKEKVITYEKN